MYIGSFYLNRKGLRVVRTCFVSVNYLGGCGVLKIFVDRKTSNMVLPSDRTDPIRVCNNTSCLNNVSSENKEVTCTGKQSAHGQYTFKRKVTCDYLQNLRNITTLFLVFYNI